MATQRTFTAEEAQKRYDALPPEIKSLLYTPEVTSVIQKVGEKNRLHYDKMGILDVETSNVMLGFTDPADFPQILASSLQIERPVADAVAKDINDMLFVKIRDAMKKPPAPAPTPAPSTPPASTPKSAVPMRDISVIMPSKATASPAAPVSSPAAVPAPPQKAASLPPEPTRPKIAPVPAAVPATPQKPEPAPAQITPNTADMMLSQPTVSAAPKPSPSAGVTPPPAKAEPPKPSTYKTDPYREPPE